MPKSEVEDFLAQLPSSEVCDYYNLHLGLFFKTSPKVFSDSQCNVGNCLDIILYLYMFFISSYFIFFMFYFSYTSLSHV